MFAEIRWEDGSFTKTSAKKVNGRWLIGGDCPSATTELGGAIYIINNGKIYRLKGNRLIFQDATGE